MMQYTNAQHEFEFRSAPSADLFDVRKTLQAMRCSLANSGVSAPVITAAEMLSAEVLNNVIEHGHAHVTSGWFNLHCAGHSQTIHFDVRDNGCPLPPIWNTPQPLTSHAALSHVPESGWGWQIIHALASDIRYRRVQDTNHLSFTLRYPPRR